MPIYKVGEIVRLMPEGKTAEILEVGQSDRGDIYNIIIDQCTGAEEMLWVKETDLSF